MHISYDQMGIVFSMHCPYINNIERNAITRNVEKHKGHINMNMISTNDKRVYRVTSMYENFHKTYRVVANDARNARNVLSRDMNTFERIAFFNIHAYIETKRV